MKKFVAVLLAVIMVLSMTTVVAFADDPAPATNQTVDANSLVTMILGLINPLIQNLIGKTGLEIQLPEISADSVSGVLSMLTPLWNAFLQLCKNLIGNIGNIQIPTTTTPDTTTA